MHDLRHILLDARKRKVAIGHFNVSDSVALAAVVSAASELGVPVMVGVSEGEGDFMGRRQVMTLVRSFREEYGLPIFLNSDHTHSLEKAKEAARAGFDEILFDGSKLPFEENVRGTREAVRVVKAINPEVLVEGELGYLGSGSEVLERVPEGAALAPENLTTASQAKEFVHRTGVDVLAPAVGNMHGLLKSMVEGKEQKHLDIPRIEEIRKGTGAFLTLHGGSGTADDDFMRAIRAGITIIHINTELRLAWRKGLERSFSLHPEEIAPYKLYKEPLEFMNHLVKERLKLFSGMK